MVFSYLPLHICASKSTRQQLLHNLHAEIISGLSTLPSLSRHVSYQERVLCTAIHTRHSDQHAVHTWASLLSFLPTICSCFSCVEEHHPCDDHESSSYTSPLPSFLQPHDVYTATYHSYYNRNPSTETSTNARWLHSFDGAERCPYRNSCWSHRVSPVSIGSQNRHNADS